jgi:hypothetical protein
MLPKIGTTLYDDVLILTSTYTKIIQKASLLLEILRRKREGFSWTAGLYFQINRYLEYDGGTGNKVFQFMMDSESCDRFKSDAMHTRLSLPKNNSNSNIVLEEELFQMNTILDDLSLVHYCVHKINSCTFNTVFVSSCTTIQEELHELSRLEYSIDMFTKYI